MISKAHVLLRIQYLQEGGRGIALIRGAQLIDFVYHEDRVLGFYYLQSLQDFSGHSADIGTPVALDFSLVAHPADGKTEELFAQGPGDRFSDRCLSHTRSTDQAQNGALGVLFEFTNRQVFENTVLHILQPIVILLQHLMGILHLEILRLWVLPRK